MTDFDKNIEEAFSKKVQEDKSTGAVLAMHNPYDNIFRDYISRKRIEKALQLNKNDIVLDFGTGVGRLAQAYASKVKTIIGVDRTKKMIEFCEENIARAGSYGNLKFQHLIDSALPFDAEYFDKIFTFWVLQHISDEELKKIAKEFFRTMKSGGLLVVGEQVEDKYKVLDNWNIHRPKEWYINFFEECGFKLKYTNHIVRNPSYGMSIWKKMKAAPQFILPILNWYDNIMINRKPEIVDYYTDGIVFVKP